MGLSSWQPWWHYFAVWPVGPNTSISSFLCFNIWWYFQKSVWCSIGIDYVIGAWCKADTKHISCWCFYQNCYWTAPIFVHFCIRSDISGCTQMICPVTLTILQSDRSVPRRVRLDSFVGAISVDDPPFPHCCTSQFLEILGRCTLFSHDTILLARIYWLGNFVKYHHVVCPFSSIGPPYKREKYCVQRFSS